MTEPFVPLVLQPRPPSAPVAMPMPSAAPQQERVRTSVVTHVSREIDLLTLSASGTPGVLTTNDYFLTHPGDGSPQRCLVSSIVARPDRFTIQLVEKRNAVVNELTDTLSLNELPADPVSLEDIKPGSGWPVFLRVTALYPSSSRSIFATLEVLTSSVS